VVITKEHDRRSPFFRVLKSYRCWRVKVIFLIKVMKIIIFIFLKWWWTLLNLWKKLSRKYQVNRRDITCLLEWWRKHGSTFPNVGFLVQHILEIIDL
jgi:hypothetical protein